MPLTLDEQIMDVLTDPPDGILVMPSHKPNATSRVITWDDIEWHYRCGGLTRLFDANYALTRSQETNSPTGMAFIAVDSIRQQFTCENDAWRRAILAAYNVEFDPDIIF